MPKGAPGVGESTSAHVSELYHRAMEIEDLRRCHWWHGFCDGRQFEEMSGDGPVGRGGGCCGDGCGRR